MQAVKKTQKLGFYGRILAIVGALPALFVSSLSIPAIVRDISSLSYWDIPILLLGFSAFIFILLITLDFWQSHFSNVIFRFHTVFILAVLSIMPFFGLMLIGIVITQAGIVLIPLAALILVGLLLTLTEHLETGFKERDKLANKKLKLNALFGVLIALILNLAIIFTGFSMAKIANENVRFGDLDGLYINVSNAPSKKENTIKVIISDSDSEYWPYNGGSRKFVLNGVKYPVDKKTKKIIYGIVSNKNAQFIKLDNNLQNITSNKQFVIQLKRPLPNKLKVELLDKNKNSISDWAILTKKKTTDSKKLTKPFKIKIRLFKCSLNAVFVL